MIKKKYGVIGHPIGHTLSPFIHKRLMELSGIDGEYGVYDIAPDVLDERFADTLSQLDGFNVTIPHKQAIIHLMNETDETAKLYGSVNTVHITRVSDNNYTAKGYTTDGIGFVSALKTAGISLNGTVTIAGCGGVGRVFANTCAKEGCKLNILETAASLDSAKQFADELNARFKSEIANVYQTACFNGESDLFINATPVGMFPNVNNCVVNDSIIEKSKAVFDAVYNPAQTLLVSKAQNMGIKALSGMTMLVYQAAASQTIWNGSQFDNKDIEKLADNCYKELACK
ncbi:MAG: shikimate dehydrogenase [Clostridia bacterium]|nr:shikimate dehydrogenase [Clostridia bacterium]